MADLKKLFPLQNQNWWESPCATCTKKAKLENKCQTGKCLTFDNWFRAAWKRACAEIKEMSENDE